MQKHASNAKHPVDPQKKTAAGIFLRIPMKTPAAAQTLTAADTIDPASLDMEAPSS
jgi:hypothetical protein